MGSDVCQQTTIKDANCHSYCQSQFKLHFGLFRRSLCYMWHIGFEGGSKSSTHHPSGPCWRFSVNLVETSCLCSAIPQPLSPTKQFNHPTASSSPACYSSIPQPLSPASCSSIHTLFNDSCSTFTQPLHHLDVQAFTLCLMLAVQPSYNLFFPTQLFNHPTASSSPPSCSITPQPPLPTQLFNHPTASSSPPSCSTIPQALLPQLAVQPSHNLSLNQLFNHSPSPLLAVQSPHSLSLAICSITPQHLPS